MEKTYTSIRLIDSKPKKVIVDESGKIINRNPIKSELKDLGKFPEKDGRSNSRPHQIYSDKFLLNELERFEKENGRPPREKEFTNRIGYPSEIVYRKVFGSWINALMFAGLDIDLMGRQGDKYRGRWAEIVVVNYFKGKAIDLSGKNRNSPCDGICPNGKFYEVKGSKLYNDMHWSFGTNNKFRDDIEIYYFLAFNKDWTKLDYAWRIPGELIDSDIFNVWLEGDYKFTVDNMERYNITDEITEVLISHWEK